MANHNPHLFLANVSQRISSIVYLPDQPTQNATNIILRSHQTKKEAQGTTKDLVCLLRSHLHCSDYSCQTRDDCLLQNLLALCIWK